MSNDTQPSDSIDQSADSSGARKRRTPEVYSLDKDGQIDTELLARDIIRLTWDLKALNARAIDLRGRVSYTDYVVVCTATADRQLQAVARHVINSLAAAGFQPLGMEGLDSGQWALVDFGDVILHVFNPDMRQEYDLERIWRDAPRLEFDDAPDELYGHFETQRF